MLALIKSSGFDSIPIPPPLNQLKVEEAPVDYSTPAPIQIPAAFRVNWSNIVARFEKEFATTFSKSKKAHFDCLPREYKVVDGARVRWYPLLLLDAMIFILHNNYFRFATRRAFNQLEVLYDCILAEIEATQPDFYSSIRALEYQKQLSWPLENDGPIIYEDMSIEEQTSIASREEQKNLIISLQCAEKFPGIQIEQIEYPWHSVEELKNRVIEDPPSKSKQKFFTIIDYLSRHHSFQHAGLSFPVLVKAMICKVLAYCGSNRALMVPTFSSSTHTTPSMARGESTSKEEFPVIITPMHHSPATSIVRAEDLSHNFDDCELPPSGTVIARSQPKRKRSPKAMMKREPMKLRRGNYQTPRHEIVYSQYPENYSVSSVPMAASYPLPISQFPKVPTPTMASSTREFMTGNENSFLNPFSDEEHELLLQSSFPSPPKPNVRTVTMTDPSGMYAVDYRSRSNSIQEVTNPSQEMSSVSWDETIQPTLQLSSDSIFNISTDTIDLEEERNLREEKLLMEENEEFSRRAESASLFQAASSSPTKDMMVVEPSMDQEYSMPREIRTPTEEELVEEVVGSAEGNNMATNNWIPRPPPIVTSTSPQYSTQGAKITTTPAVASYPQTQFYQEKASPRSVQSVLAAPKGWFPVYPSSTYGIAAIGPQPQYYMTSSNATGPASPTHFSVPVPPAAYNRQQYYLAVLPPGSMNGRQVYYGNYEYGAANYVQTVSPQMAAHAASGPTSSPRSRYSPSMGSFGLYEAKTTSEASSTPDANYMQ